MNWLALSPLQVAAIWGALGALALWFYLHHRRPQRRRVSTLRFWASVQPISQPRRRKVREPWALLAQLLFLLFMILALANPRWGGTFQGRSVAIVIDTSIWSQARPPGGTPWIDRARQDAQRLVNSLPLTDRVLLLRTEAAAPPILPFTTDRVALRRAISGVQTSSSTADVPRALQMGKEALAGSEQGLLAYVGPGMLDDAQAHEFDAFRADMESPAGNGGRPQFLVRLTSDEGPLQNRGITRLSIRRDETQPDRWHLLTQLKNYGNDKFDVLLKLSIDGQPLGQQTISLAPNELANAENEFTWDKGGLLQAEIGPSDALEADNRAVVNLPPFRSLEVALFANGGSPFVADLRSVLSSNPYVDTQILPPGSAPSFPPDVAIYQAKALPAQPEFNSIWFLSGASSPNSPPMRVVNWNRQHPVTRWVRTHDVSVRNPATLQVQPDDTVLAYADGNPPTPLILAREQDGHRLLIVGFDPHDSNFPLESAFPLLMAGGMEWMTHSVDEGTNALSTGEVDIPGPVTRIVAPSGRDVPFARQGSDVHLLALETGMYRIIRPGGETSLAVNTQLLPAQRLQPTPSEIAGIARESFQPEGSDLWRWPVLLGIVALWLEWLLYYSSRERQRISEIPIAAVDELQPHLEREFDDRAGAETRNSNLVGR